LTDGEAWAASQPADKFPNRKFLDALTPISPERFDRHGFATNVGFVPTLGEKVFALATQPASDAAGSHKVAAIPVPRMYKWAVAELKDMKPLYQDEFKTAQIQTRDMAAQSAGQQFYMQWLSLENIQKRTGWTPRGNVQ